MNTVTKAAIAPSAKAARAPNMSCDRMSRPSGSVPNR